jgi:GTP cyclohydrolase I
MAGIRALIQRQVRPNFRAFIKSWAKARDLRTFDVQSDPDSRKLAIDKVGIKAIRHPVRIQERRGEAQHTIALFNMYVGLPHHFKGTHMSRFVEILEAHEREITVETFQLMLREMVDKLEAEEGHIEMSFPYFIERRRRSRA